MESSWAMEPEETITRRVTRVFDVRVWKLDT